MKAQQARELGNAIAGFIHSGQLEEVEAALAPALSERTPFRLLDILGATLGQGEARLVDPFLDRICDQRTIGGWVVIGSALRQHFPSDLPGALDRSLDYIRKAGVWYGVDSLAERVPGPALLYDFDTALSILTSWRDDPDAWVRRAAGVAVHFFTKRTQGAAIYLPQVERVLAFLDPLFSEQDSTAIKGVGWGLKTIGKFYPDLLADWLVKKAPRPHRALMMRKALTYLNSSQRAQVRIRAI